ncbi:MAG: hypothetical protein Q8L02_02430 [Candidatus Nitrotoga sp.]|nr:hypothetical protein [Candidatus Nitrotoga sp.]
MCFTSPIITSDQTLRLVIPEKPHFIASVINRAIAFIMAFGVLAVKAVRHIAAIFLDQWPFLRRAEYLCKQGRTASLGFEFTEMQHLLFDVETDEILVKMRHGK